MISPYTILSLDQGKLYDLRLHLETQKPAPVADKAKAAKQQPFPVLLTRTIRALMSRRRARSA